MAKNKPKKPTGVTGACIMSLGDVSAQAEFLPLKFPKAKEEIEAFIVGSFLNEGKKRPNFFSTHEIEVKQNKLDDYDFTLYSPYGEMSLELMEIAPLENLLGSYENAPKSYKPYDFAKFIFDKLMGKSVRYASSTGDGLILLMYVTDWHFALSETIINLLKYWTAQTQHSFEEIFFYVPIEPEGGLPYLIYPIPGVSWENFNPETYKENVVQIVGPIGWKPHKGGLINS